MADNAQISIEIQAIIDQLSSQLNEAGRKISDFSSGTKQAGEEASGGMQKFASSMKYALAGGEFLIYEQIAKQVLSTINELFDATAGKAEEFGLRVGNFAQRMGISMEQAAGLAMALKSVGSSSDAYASTALRLTMRLNTQEGALKRMGVETRNADGSLVNQVQLMDNAFAALNQYKEGTDRNSMSLQIFGRRVGDVNDMMRATQAVQQQYKEDARNIGVQFDGEKEKAEHLQVSLGRLNNAMDSIGIALGQRIEEPLAKLIDDYLPMFISLLSSATETGGFFARSLTNIGTQLASQLLGPLGSAIGLLIQFRSLMGEPIPVPVPVPKPKTDKGGDASAVNVAEAQKLAAELLAIKEKLAMASAAIDEDMNATQLALGQRTVDEYASEARRIEDIKYNAELHYLQGKARLDADDKAARARDLGEIEVLAKSHTLAMQKIDDQVATHKKQVQETELAYTEQNLQEQLAIGMGNIEEDYNAHRISIDEKVALERQLTAAIFTEALKQLDIHIATLETGTDAWRAAMQQRLQLVSQFVQKDVALQRQAAAATREDWDKLGSSIKSSFASAITGMITGTMTFKQALGSILDSIVGAFVNMIVDMGARWIAGLIANELFTEVTGLGQVIVAADVAAANAYAAYAWNPPLAATMATQAFFTVMSFAPAAEKGMVVKEDQMIFAHKDEMVLPANLTRGLQSLIEGGGGGGNPNFNYAPTINAPKNQSLEDMLRTQGSSMLKFIKEAHRDGKLRMQGNGPQSR